MFSLHPLRLVLWMGIWLIPQAVFAVRQPRQAQPANIRPAIQKQLDRARMAASRHQTDSVTYHLNRALDISLHSGSVREQMQVHYEAAKILQEIDAYYRANEQFAAALHLARQSGDTLGTVDLLIDRSYLYDYWQMRDSAAAFLSRAFDLAHRAGYRKGKARAALLLGNMYWAEHKTSQALEYYRQTFDIARSIPDSTGMAAALQNIGLCLAQQGDNAGALEHFERSAAILQNIPSERLTLAGAYGNLALLYARQGDKAGSFAYLNRAMDIYRRHGNAEQKAIGYHTYARCLYELKNYSLSNRYLDSCIALARNNHFGLMLQTALHQYALNEKKAGNYKAALDFMERYTQVKDSLATRKYHRQLAELNVKYKTRERQHQIRQLQLAKAQEKARFRYLLIASILLLLTFLATGYVLIQKRKIARLQWEKMRLEAKNLADELARKNKQLSEHALHMLHKNELLSGILKRLEALINAPPGQDRDHLKQLQGEIRKMLRADKDWEVLSRHFERINEDFVRKIRSVNPHISTNDLRLATLMKMNLTNKEIAQLLNINYQSVKNAQYRLKRKLNLAPGENLRVFLASL